MAGKFKAGLPQAGMGEAGFQSGQRLFFDGYGFMADPPHLEWTDHRGQRP